MLNMGATKRGEYSRTIEMLCDKTGATELQIMEALYLLYDSQYDSKDLLAMADQVYKNLKLRKKL